MVFSAISKHTLWQLTGSMATLTGLFSSLRQRVLLDDTIFSLRDDNLYFVPSIVPLRISIFALMVGLRIAIRMILSGMSLHEL